MSVDVRTTIEIECATEDVAGYASNPANAPQWYENIKSVEWEGSPIVQVGARMAFVAHFLGRRLAYTYEMVEYEPGRKLVMRTAEGPFPMETTYEWESIDPTRTRMSLRNCGTPSGFGRAMAPLMSMAMRRANEKDLKALKKLLEKR